MRRADCHPRGLVTDKKKPPVVVVIPISVIFTWFFDGFWSDHHLGSKFLRVSVPVAPVGCLAPVGIFAWELAWAAWLGGNLEKALGRNFGCSAAWLEYFL